MRCLLGPALAFVLLFGGTSAADPLTITSGVINFTDEPGGFDVAGQDFDLDFGWFPKVVSGTFWFDRCRAGCPLGSTVDFGTTTYGFHEQFQGYGGSVNGVSYPELFRIGEVTFTGPVIAIPPTLPETFARLEGPFSFHGTVSLFTEPSGTTPIFSGELTGRGTAKAIVSIDAPGTAIVEDLDYIFGSPVPEPSTLVMLVSGLIGGAAGLRRRRYRTTQRGSRPHSDI
jgi:hypothetical protein